MKLIEKYNTELVRNDIEALYKILRNLLVEEDYPILILGWLQYFILIIVESIKYSGMNITLKHKRIIENCRARIKPFEVDYNEMYANMEKLNLEKYTEYKNKVSEMWQGILDCFITNYGVYKIDNNIIGNTFLYEGLYKKIIYENGSVNGDKIKSITQELGEVLVRLINFYGISDGFELKKGSFDIKCEDYNVFKKRNKLIRKDMDAITGLMLLNSISILNFYNNVIVKMVTRNELRYRLGYIVYDSTSKNVEKICEDQKFSETFKKYEILNNRSFRNCMFHYDLTKDLSDFEIKEEMYHGIIHKYLGINERKYIELIDNYANEMDSFLEKMVLKI